MRRWKIVAVTAVAATAAAVGAVLVTGPASAHSAGAYSTTFVDGAGGLRDDFGEHYREIGNSLCYGCGNSWNTDTVVMWQAILVAEGLLSRSGIDGKFGPGTRAATKNFQSRYGLTVDGKVGPATWGKADNRLYWTDAGVTVVYDGYGASGRLYLDRGNPYSNKYDSGSYDLNFVKDPNGNTTSFNWGHHIYHTKRTVTIDH